MPMPKTNEYIDWETGDMTTPDKDRRLTKAQAKKLNDVMEGFRIVHSVIVSDGGCMGLAKGWASVSFIGGYQMGIAPDGRAHT